MKIIKYEKKNNGQYKLHFEDKTSLDTYEEVIINNKLLSNRTIDQELLEQILSDNEYQKIYNSCIKYIEYRLRSTKEVKDYLTKKELDDKIIEDMLAKLTQIGLLNDDLFTQCFIRDKLNLTNMGEYKIKSQLKEHNIAPELIEKYDYLFEREILTNKIDKHIQKALNSRKNANNFALRGKVYNNLMNLGYSSELIIERLNIYLK